MNPVISMVLGVLVRQALTFAAGWFASHGGTQDQAAQLVSPETVGAVVALLASLALSLSQKYTERQKLLTAAAAGRPVSEAKVEAMVKAGEAPSVLTPKADVPSANG